MRRLAAVTTGVAALLLGSGPLWAQAKENGWIAEKLRSADSGNYILGTLAVLAAAILMCLGMLRRSRH